LPDVLYASMLCAAVISSVTHVHCVKFIFPPKMFT